MNEISIQNITKKGKKYSCWEKNKISLQVFQTFTIETQISYTNRKEISLVKDLTFIIFNRFHLHIKTSPNFKSPNSNTLI